MQIYRTWIELFWNFLADFEDSDGCILNLNYLEIFQQILRLSTDACELTWNSLEDLNILSHNILAWNIDTFCDESGKINPKLTESKQIQGFCSILSIIGLILGSNQNLETF